MQKYNEEALRMKFRVMGYIWPDFHLIGVRSKSDTPDRFDDTAYLFCDGKLHTFENFTTNPGAHWLQNFANPKGTAVLKPAQYVNTWQIGKHQGVYTALTQARPVTVWRDNDKDLKSEQGKEDTGFFGINIHRANPNVMSVLIGKWSAGCQVFANPKDFDFVIDKCQKSGKSQFTYTILDEF